MSFHLGPAKVKELFEKYYSLGVTRSLNKLSQTTGIDFMELNALAAANGWEQLADARDADEERLRLRLYKRKTSKIRDQLTNQIARLVDNMSNKSLGLPFEVKSPADMRALAQAYQHLVAATTTANSQIEDESSDNTPKTWSDLLGQSEIDDSILDDGSHD